VGLRVVAVLRLIGKGVEVGADEKASVDAVHDPEGIQIAKGFANT
jgi:hypothetical protein